VSTESVEMAVDNQNGVNARVEPPPVAQPTPQMTPRIKWEECIYVLFDLKTTGGSRTDDDIIELAAMIVGPDALMVEDATFQALVKPKKQISTFITILTGITHEMVATALSFSIVAVDLFDFIMTNVDADRTRTGKKFLRFHGCP
jgi:DNA polymerase III epsilon subunit-like protein